MVFKQHLTKLGRHGRRTVHRGKGATEQRTQPGQQEDLTGGSPLDRMSNRYPKGPPAPPDTSPGPTVPLGPSAGPPPGPPAPADLGPPAPMDEG